MPARLIAVFTLMAILSSVTFAAAPVVRQATEDSITVTVVGTLRTGIVAIGGETTGTTVTAKGVTWELDFGKNAEFRKAAEKLNGKKVVVQGGLERRRGVEIKERWIVTVTGLSGYEKGTEEEAGVGAVTAPVTDQAKKRAEAMKANAKTFRLELNYNGDEDKPFYRMIVSVPVVNRRRNSPFNRIVQINEEEATRIIDHLTTDGFLDAAVDLRTNIKIPAPSTPGYTMKVVTGDMPLYTDIGWGLPMIHRLDALREVFPDNGKKDMDFLLGRLSGFRALWEVEAVRQTETSFKGWELYVWEEDGQTCFSLMVGTNRLKSAEEITKSAEKGFDAIKAKLDELKKGESVFLHGRRLNEQAPGELAKVAADYCEKIGLKIQ